MSSIALVAEAVDRAVDGPVLVIGSLPPRGRDLDLLARDEQIHQLTAFLEQKGFIPWRSTWARFEEGGALGVEMTAARSWGSPHEHDGARLFEGAVPIPGFRHLMRPAANVQLVLVAQNLLLRRGVLTAGGRQRAVEAAAATDDVWDAAADLVRTLRLTAPVGLLRHSLETRDDRIPARRIVRLAVALVSAAPGARLATARSVVPRRWRPALVSLSGPDGSGKSTQTDLLRAALEVLGVSVAQEWTRTTMRPPLPRSVRAFADRWRRPGPVTNAPPGVGPAPRARRGPVPPHVRLAEHVWISSAAVANAGLVWRNVWRARAARVLVLDRFVLDAEVKLIYWYSHVRGADITFERRLFRALCPEADVAVLLTVAPETNSARRADEWELDAFRSFRRIYDETAGELGALVVDAERPVPEVARDVARLVWRGLP